MLCDYDLDYIKSDQAIKRVVELIEDLDTELHRAFDQDIVEIQNNLVEDLKRLIIDSKNGYCLSDQDVDKIIDHLISPF